MASDWAGHFERERGRYEDGIARLPGIADPDERQRQLTRIANAHYGAGLARLMEGGRAEAAAELGHAAERYRESYAGAPAGSWGRPIGAIKARLMAGDATGATEDARWALDEAAAESDSPIGRYAACLALLVLAHDSRALAVAETLRGRDDFPDDVARSLAGLAAHDAPAYRDAVTEVLRSFETRPDHLEDIAVADTVVVLEILARSRGLGAELASPLLPPRSVVP